MVLATVILFFSDVQTSAHPEIKFKKINVAKHHLFYFSLFHVRRADRISKQQKKNKKNKQ